MEATFFDCGPSLGWGSFLDRESCSDGERFEEDTTLDREPFSNRGLFLDWEPFLDLETLDRGPFLDRKALRDSELSLDESPLDESPLDESPLDESPLDESPLDEVSAEESSMERRFLERVAGDREARRDRCLDRISIDSDALGDKCGCDPVGDICVGTTVRNGRCPRKSSPGSVPTQGWKSSILLREGLADSSTMISRAGSSKGRRRVPLWPLSTFGVEHLVLKGPPVGAC